MNASTFAFRPCQGIAWNYFVLNCDIARAQSLGIKVCDIAAQCSELNTVVFVTSKPNIHDDSIFWGQVVSPIKSYNHNMALAVLLMKEDTNCLVNKVRNFNL